MKKLWYALLILLFVACNNDPRKATTIDREKNKMEQNDSVPLFSPAVAAWVNANLKTAHTTLALEERWQDDSLQQEPFQLTQSFAQNYKTVLRWSPDSNYILDIGSYGAVVEKNNDGEVDLQYGEPDTEVALIDTKKSLRTRLFYVGPSAEIKDGMWLNNTELMVLGTFKSDVGVIDTLSWKVDLQSNFFALYNIKAIKGK